MIMCYIKTYEKVLFDPRYSVCLLPGISGNAAFMYDVNMPMPLKQKRFLFSILFPKIKNMVKKNAAFYLGCLLWAVYIKNIKNAEIENNLCCGRQYDEQSEPEEINYLFELVSSKLNKDSKNYINKEYLPQAEFKAIFGPYTEFLKLNRGFVSVQKKQMISFCRLLLMFLMSMV